MSESAWRIADNAGRPIKTDAMNQRYDNALQDPRGGRFRPRFEHLEPRCLLAAVDMPGDRIDAESPPPLEDPLAASQSPILGPFQQRVQIRPPAEGPSPAQVVVPYKTVLDNGPSANRVDLVILGDGYTESQIDTDYVGHVDAMLEYLFNFGQDPFPRYAKFFNAHRITTISNQSGADKPAEDVFVDTALDATYSCGGTLRLICINTLKANTARNEALAQAGFTAEMQFVSINDSDYGGSGGTYAVFAGGNPSANELALHEIAHSFSELADEYGDSGIYSGGEPSEVNVTVDPAGTKWQRWLDGYNQPGIGTIGVYEGGRYYAEGIYRPSINSKMRSLGRPFDAVSREKIILDIYDLIDPIDQWLGNTETIESVNPELWIDLIDADVQDVQWSVNGVNIAGATDETFNPLDFGFGPGSYQIASRVYDSTDWVRHQFEKLEQTITWSVEILPTPQVRSVRINEGAMSRSQVTSVTVEFDSDVSVSAASFVLTNRDTLETVDLQLESSPSPTGTIARLTFAPGPSVHSRHAPSLHSLVDGNYKIEVVGSMVTLTAGGSAMQSDFLFGNRVEDAFFRLYGDSDADRDVDGQDFGRFGLSFLQLSTSEHFDAWLDLDGDGDVDGQDHSQFGRRWLKSMAL